MTPEVASKMFLAAAIFNWVVGAALFFVPNLFLAMLSVSPGVHQLLWVQQFAGLVFVFGIGYYWASKDFAENQNTDVEKARHKMIKKVTEENQV